MINFTSRICLAMSCLFISVSLSAQNADCTRISLCLADQANATQYSGQTIRVGIELESDLSLSALDKQLYAENASLAQRSSTVINALKSESNTKQPAFIQSLPGIRGVRLSTVERFWISNVLFVNATPDAILHISLLPGVSYIDIDADLALGSRVMATNLDPWQELQTELSLAEQASGVYYLRITGGDRTMVKKVVKN